MDAVDEFQPPPADEADPLEEPIVRNIPRAIDDGPLPEGGDLVPAHAPEGDCAVTGDGHEAAEVPAGGWGDWGREGDVRAAGGAPAEDVTWWAAGRARGDALRKEAAAAVLNVIFVFVDT